jgi:hypothetical protein
MSVFERRVPSPIGFVAIAPVGVIAITPGFDSFIDLREASITQNIGAIQSLYLDCSAMTSPVTAIAETTSQEIFWPAGGAGWQNMVLRDNAVIRLRSLATGNVRGAVSANPIPSALHLTGLPASDVQTATASTFQNVLASASSVAILPSNARRVGVSIFNDSTQPLYLMLANLAATVTQFSALIAANSFFALPVNYLGPINGMWGAAVGGARVTEFSR